ncbi:hypothetical protein EXIGLDRAFT_754569 [Exidia glandulosa HHB12029]|uniref:Uncharacterized protein n=1 Tax=Exidia glandulosa HHB12029 TaxID=1314781 RepID=A0A165CUC7_EXIGL|nr:hypothetical protein EXIGLDRAFT_754569 [Exidia glandulosa HHB12029]
MSEPDLSKGAAPELPPPPSRVLQLSTLLWEWTGPDGPTTVVVDGEGPDERPIGRYSAGPSTRIALDLESPWSPEHSAFVYNLPEAQPSLTLRYTRRTFVGTVSSDVTYYGTIAGVYSQATSETIGPKLCVHRVDADPFPETLEPVEGVKLKRGPGPPFEFIDFDWVYDGVPPSGIGERSRALNIDVPDLPGQNEDDLEESTHDDDDEIEEDGSELRGWSGDWVKTLLERRERGEDVGSRTEVKWCSIGQLQFEGSKWVDTRLWGVEIEFEAQDFEEHWPDRETPAGRRYLEGYTVVATIKRFFITPEWYTDAADEGAST